MFYKIGSTIDEISVDKINESEIIAGYITSDELAKLAPVFGFSESAVEACHTENPLFRTDVEVHDNYTFTELRITSGNNEDDDRIALFLKKNLMLVVDILDTDNRTRLDFEASVRKFPEAKRNFVRITCSFIESLIAGDNTTFELMRNEIASLEEIVVSGKADSKFNIELLGMKKKLLKLHNYYEQLIDIAEVLEENSNDIFDDDNLIYVSNLTNKVNRLRDDADWLSNSLDHLQDAYSSSLDLNMNNTMKLFTVITSIFFPLTIIVGWYGMNFTTMPELTWKYGYLYVIIMSVTVILMFVLFGKRKKWF